MKVGSRARCYTLGLGLNYPANRTASEAATSDNAALQTEYQLTWLFCFNGRGLHHSHNLQVQKPERLTRRRVSPMALYSSVFQSFLFWTSFVHFFFENTKAVRFSFNFFLCSQLVNDLTQM